MPETIINVSSSSELLAALSAATGGETIVLSSGDYGGVDLSNLQFSSMVTITSQDPLGANFRSITLDSSDNIRFDGIELEYILGPDEPIWSKAIKIDNSTNIEFINSDLHGSDDGNYSNDAYIFNITGSSNIVISNNSIHDAFRGAVIYSSDHVQLVDNEVYDIRSDGFDFVGVEDVLISGNDFTNFHPDLDAGDHADAIQFWNVGSTRESGNVTIDNNTFMQGEGDEFQSIFIAGYEDMGYYNFTITNNLIYNGSPHGITVNMGRDFTISNNTVLQSPDGQYEPSIRVAGSTGPIEVSDNASALILETSEYVTSTNNVEVQNTDGSLSTYYGNLFFDAFSGADAAAEDFMAIPGSLLNSGALIGAYGYSAITDQLQAQAVAETYIGSSDGLKVTFDGSYTSDIDGNPGVIGVSYEWDFGDGTTDEGILVEHTYAEEGNYTAVLTVTRDGVSDNTTHTVSVKDPHVLEIVDAGSSDIRSLSGNMTAEDDTLNFDGTGYVNLGRPADLFGLDEMYISFDVNPDGMSESSAMLVYSHMRYSVALKGDDLTFTVYTDDGGMNKLTVNDVNIFDGAFHNVAMSFDSASGTLTALVDGEEMGSLSGVVGSVEGVGYWDVALGGSLWGSFFSGEIDNFNVWTAPAPIESTAVITETLPVEETVVEDTTIDDTTTEVVAEPVVAPVDEPVMEEAAPEDATTETITEPVLEEVATDTTATETTSEPVMDASPTTEPVQDVPPSDAVTEPVVDATTSETTTDEPVEPVVTYDTNLLLSISGSADALGYAAEGNSVIGEDAMHFYGKGYVNLGQEADLFGMDAFTLSFDLTAGIDKGDNKGTVRLVWNQERYGVEMDGDDLIFRVYTDTGDSVVLRAEDVGVGDGGSHAVVMSYDSASGVMSGYVDGVQVVEASGITGSIAEAGRWDVTVGGTPRGRHLDGEIDNLTMWSDADHTPDSAYADASLAIVDEGAAASTATAADSTDPSLSPESPTTTEDGAYNPDDYWDSTSPDSSLV